MAASKSKSKLELLSENWVETSAQTSIRAALLADYHAIKALRDQGCPWPVIAESLGGRPADPVRQAWLRLEAAIKEGKLTPPPKKS